MLFSKARLDVSANAWSEADGSKLLFSEIFHETSTGDFGIQVKKGPLLRCHSDVLKTSGGFIGKVRQFGTPLPRNVDPNDRGPSPIPFFRMMGYDRLLEEAAGVKFAQPIDKSCLFHCELIDGERPEDPLRPGYTTAHFIGGTQGVVKRADPFFLAERYEIDCDCERVTELLRFVYQGRMYFFEEEPTTEKHKEVLTKKMLHICFDAERYSVDLLYTKMLEWFAHQAFKVVGDRHFTEAFYHLQHFEFRVTEEHSREALLETVTGEMLAKRDQFVAVTRDPRWGSLPVDFLMRALSSDGLAVNNEAEVLNLIERWNAKADKTPEEIIKLLTCFRPDEQSRKVLIDWLTNLGWLDAHGNTANVKGLDVLKKILDGTTSKGKKSRVRNEMDYETQQKLAMGQKVDWEEPKDSERNVFHLYKGHHVVHTGTSFMVGAGHRVLQDEALRSPGVVRLRVTLSSPSRLLWNPLHEVFVGLSYGEGRYFGFLCSATAYSGIFSVRALASVSPAPSAPAHFTGSGNKMEFDMGLEVQYQRVNLVVTCKLSIIYKNETITEELFQISHHTLTTGPGLRFQAVATGLGHDHIDVQLGWVGGGGADDAQDEEEEVVPGLAVLSLLKSRFA